MPHGKRISDVRFRRLAAVLVAVLLMASSIASTGGLGIKAESVTERKGSIDTANDFGNENYIAYSQKYIDKLTPSADIVLKPTQNCRIESGDIAVEDYSGREAVLVWKSNDGTVSLDFEVEREGKYFLRFDYLSFNNNASNVQFSLKIDGNYPFFESSQLEIPKAFQCEADTRQDDKGNDIRPDLTAYEGWITSPVNVTGGASNKPYAFYLSAGRHTLSVIGAVMGIAIDTIAFYNEPALLPYSEYCESASVVQNGYTQRYEAEKPLYVSSRMLYPVYDRTSIDTSPSDPSKMRYNTIGQSNYATNGQYIVWNIEVPESGYYYLGARVRQNLSVGMISYRRLYINGKVPFKEADSIPFAFETKWRDFIFGGETPWLVYLNAGDNTVCLEVVQGATDGVVTALNSLVTKANELYLKIITITGTSPDMYRDYALESAVVDFSERLDAITASGNQIMEEAKVLGMDTSGDLSALQKLLLLVENFRKNPAEAATKVATLNTYVSGVSSLIQKLSTQPLEIDTITVSDDEESLKTAKSGFFTRTAFSFRAFLASFFDDYETGTSSAKGKTKLRVWVNKGRDQATILSNMSNSMFSAATGIDVDVSISAQSLVQASLSGNGPDVVLYVGEGDPVNLAMRNGLLPVDEFENFETVKNRFHEAAFTPYQYEGHYYAIPLTQSFPVMFYRTDIFAELGIEAPETWDDFFRVVRVLQHNNLTAGIPNADSSNVMSVDTTIYEMLLYQRGKTLYSEDLKTTNFETIEGVSAFITWTDFYKTYGLPSQFNFFNRFRSGDMPIGISSYGMYGQLSISAPEIKGRWAMCAIPGTIDANGNINRLCRASGSAAIIMKNSAHRNEAWQYIDWFSDAQAQTQFGQEIEALLGPSGRYDTANLEAFENLPWTYAQKQVIKNQWENTFTVPQVPGGYYVTRNLINAFRKVVYKSNNPRETIISYNKNIVNEMERKRKEFGLD